MLVPIIDLGICSKCLGCIDVCPTVFQFNEVTGNVDVVDLSQYPHAEVDEAIKLCPKDCISWDKDTDGSD